MNYVAYISYICFFIGLVLAGIWVMQEVSTIEILDNPSSGAIGFLLLGMTLSFLTRRKSST